MYSGARNLRILCEKQLYNDVNGMRAVIGPCSVSTGVQIHVG